MTTIYKMDADDLDETFIENVKSTFRNKQIEIRVSEEDTTEYLLSTEANRHRILEAIADIESNKNLIRVDLSKF